MEINIDFACRACLQETLNGVSVNEIVQDYKVNIGEILTVCTGVDIFKMPDYPDKICESCSLELPEVWKFIKMCKSSNEALEKYYENKKKDLEDKHSLMKFEIKLEYNPPSVNSHISADDMDQDADVKLSDQDTKENLNEIKGKRNLKSKRITKKKVKNSKSDFKCPSCILVFDTELRFRKHLKSEHPSLLQQMFFTCKDCKKQFKRKSDLIVHQRVHSGDKPFACKHCPQRFAQSGTLIEHVRCHTGETPFSCKICSRVFSSRSSFWRHRLVHSGEKPYACEQCGRTFAHGATLKHHRLVHTQDRPHSCKLCGKATKTKYSLQQHMVTHSEKHYVCEHCGKKFSMKYNLENHIKNMHSDEAGQCFFCKKITSNLSEHMTIHTGETPYRCHICDRTFRQKNSLSFHVTLHKNAEKYKCKVEGCTKAFPKQNMLDFHTRKVHSNETPHICPHCSKGFFRASDLSRHINTLHPDEG